jgi:hypothetical protein
MAEQYHVVFSGQIIEHADLDMVKHNVARAFKLPAEQADKLFSGKRIALKKNVDAATAEKYRVTLEHAGALCEIVSSDAASQPSPQTQADTAVDTAGGMTLAEVGITLVEARPLPEVNIDTSGMDMAELGITLVEATPLPVVNIDTSGMDMAEAGITLAEPTSLPEVNIDTSALQLADDQSLHKSSGKANFDV